MATPLGPPPPAFQLTIALLLVSRGLETVKRLSSNGQMFQHGGQRAFTRGCRGAVRVFLDLLEGPNDTQRFSRVL